MLIRPCESSSFHGFGIWECSWTSRSSDDTSKKNYWNILYPRVGADAVLLSPSRAWHAAHYPSKIALPRAESPSGIVTLGSAFAFLGGIYKFS